MSLCVCVWKENQMYTQLLNKIYIVIKNLKKFVLRR